jgi:hypothetical protein
MAKSPAGIGARLKYLFKSILDVACARIGGQVELLTEFTKFQGGGYLQLCIQLSLYPWSYSPCL